MGVFRRGEPQQILTAGMANIAGARPVTQGTTFELASLSKAFVAATILKLAEDKLIRLDDPVSRFFPDPPRVWERLTVRHLLNHTSGMPRVGRDPGTGEWNDRTDEGILASARGAQLLSEPGEKWSYSNLGYELLGLIIGKVTGKHWEVAMRERIFDPIGMTTAGRKIQQVPRPQAAQGYAWEAGALVEREDVGRPFTPPGGVVASIADMAKWEKALSGDAFLTAGSRRDWWEYSALNNGDPVRYGLGWFLNREDGREIAWHGGANTGFTAHIHRNLASGRTVIVLCNLDGADLDPLVEEVLQLADEQ